MVKQIDFDNIYINLKQFILFNIVGIINFINHQVIFLFFSLTINNLIFSNIFAFIIACIVGYFLHIKFTFKTKKTLSIFFKYFFLQGSLFFGCFFIFMFVYKDALSLIEILIFNIYFVVLNFLFMKFLVFGSNQI